MPTCQQSNDRVVEHAAKKAAPSNRTDPMGRDRDDYRQLFAMKSWLADMSVPDHGETTVQKWRFTAVRNQLRSYKRELVRQPEVLRYDMLEDDRRHAPSFEKLMERRDALQKLEAHLTQPEARLLVDYVAHGYKLMGVWNARGRPGSYRHFCRRFRAVTDKCRRFFLTNCPGLVLKSSGQRYR